MKRILAVLLGLGLTLGLAWAVELSDFQPHMKKAAKSVKALKKQLAAEDAEGAAASAKNIAMHYGHMTKMWEADHVEDATNWSKESEAAASEIAAKVAAGDFEGANAAAATLGKTCRTCHTAHRTKHEDKTYSIK